jgi:hypothetical protein
MKVTVQVESVHAAFISTMSSETICMSGRGKLFAIFDTSLCRSWVSLLFLRRYPSLFWLRFPVQRTWFGETFKITQSEPNNKKRRRPTTETNTRRYILRSLPGNRVSSVGDPILFFFNPLSKEQKGVLPFER